MKLPTKSELYEQIDALTKENIKLQEKLDEEKQKRWLSNKDKAITAFFSTVPVTVLQIRKLVLDHIDNAGYWFTFELDNDNRRQTYCVRHTDL